MSPLVLALALACHPATAEVDAYDSVLIDGIPHVRQEPDFCGEACLAMWLSGTGHETDQDAVFDATGLDPSLGRGAWTREMKSTMEALGYDPGKVWHTIPALGWRQDIEPLWAQLHADLLAGIPSIVCTRYDERPDSSEHFRLILGYDAQSDEVIYHEPAADDGAYRRMDREQMLDLWPLKYSRGAWTVIRLRLAPVDVHAPVPSQERSAADYAQQVMKVRAPLTDDFTVLVEPPWVVVGDERPDMVQVRAEGTVRWATERLKQDYFAEDPDEIWTIYLFKDDESYRRWAMELFGDDPDTPYGYADGDTHALVMNIATGGGTLVHEMVHPYVHANLGETTPAWFNEGLASLYEACGERDGHIVGFTNWRLAGLQAALQADAVPSFEWLTSRSQVQFYNDDPGTHYAQSRYLFQYLQERGLIVDYYRAYEVGREADPSGYAALRRVLGVDDMEAFEEQWAQWVLGL